ncbi:MAG: cation-translocating P-type ATPase [Lachnospiraceae bacterium]|nr:cation-translocating P-type ATPase [Lachnospiraceae bacterium]
MRESEKENWLDTDRKQGLSEEEVKKRREICGKNELEQEKKKSYAVLLFEQLNDPLIAVLIVAAGISVLLGEIYDAAIIAFVIALNAIVGVIQEGKAIRALDALKKLTSPIAVVRREGKVKEIEASLLVPGDVVLLDAGCQVPADMQILDAISLKIEESALTGESIPVEKRIYSGTEKEKKDSDLFSNEMAYMTTNVLNGRGEGLVTATGMQTQIGKIAHSIKNTVLEATPLQKRLADMGKLLSILAVVLCVLLFGIAVFQKRNLPEMLITAISLAVAAVPEGLPAVVTIVLALSVSRMVKIHAIVRRLPSVETLGSVSVVCSDKTGTLTENHMTAVAYYADGRVCRFRHFELKEEQEKKKGKWLKKEKGKTEKKEIEKSEAEKNRIGKKQKEIPAESDFLSETKWAVEEKGIEQYKKMLEGFLLCNDAKVGETCIGDPTEIALLEMVPAAVRNEILSSASRITEIPFSSERKKMTTLHRKRSKQIIYSKGSVEEILKQCSYIEDRGKILPLSAERRQQIVKAAKEMSDQALRVLATCYREETEGTDLASMQKNTRTEQEWSRRLEKDMIFTGMAGLKDPVREGVKEAVSLFKSAGVKTVMITGDHADTALAIAKELGIAGSQKECLTGAELEALTEEERKRRLPDIHVFARVSPVHKVKIVKTLKEAGNIVAMTGDGVNDAPSLKAADIGIAMGKNGTDVARNAADFVLTDDNFTTIEHAIEEGRGIYENIRKSILFLLSSNFGEIITMFFAILFWLPSPLRASHILWINLITDTLPALALGIDENDTAYLMRHPPRNPKESLFAKGGLFLTLFYGFVIAGITLLAFFTIPYGYLTANQIPFTISNILQVLNSPEVLSRSQTYAFTVLGLSQLFHAIGMRNIHMPILKSGLLKNQLMLFAFFIGIGLQVAVTEIPYLTMCFGTARLSLGEWGALLLIAAIPLFVHDGLLAFSKRETY